MQVNLTTNTPTAANAKIREATQQFEGLFLAQMLEAMRKTAPTGGILPANSGEQMFRQMFDQEIAQRMAQSGGVGIGEMLYQQFVGSVAKEKTHADR